MTISVTLLTSMCKIIILYQYFVWIGILERNGRFRVDLSHFYCEIVNRYVIRDWTVCYSLLNMVLWTQSDIKKFRNCGIFLTVAVIVWARHAHFWIFDATSRHNVATYDALTQPVTTPNMMPFMCEKIIFTEISP